MRVTGENADELLGGHLVIIDGSDTFATRLAVSDSSVRLQTTLVTAAAAQFQAQVAAWRGWEAGTPCYRCFVGDAFDADDCDTCAELGVLGALVGTAGQFAALMAIQSIVGFGPGAGGRVHLLDGLALAWRSLRVTKDPACRACGGAHAAYP